MNDMNQQPAPVGDLFSRVYLERGTPLQDSRYFRNRLAAYIGRLDRGSSAAIQNYLQQEGGLTFWEYGSFVSFFDKDPIEHVLNAVTLIWRYFRTDELRRGYPGTKSSGDWRSFVARALREENMGYQLDEKCGVHYFVDEEFERNRVSALACLQAPRYAGVRVAFEAAHGYLDAQPADTKASVRSAFESLEILAKLMDPDSRTLSKRIVENKLKPMALVGVTEPAEAETVSKLFDGLALMVDGLHNYRHGQGVEQPVVPSLTMTVYVISTVAAALRWLTALDAQEE